MKRKEMYDLLLGILNLENDRVSEGTLLDSFDFNSLAKLGVISIMDAYADTVISAKDLINCKTISDILNLNPTSNKES